MGYWLIKSTPLKTLIMNILTSVVSNSLTRHCQTRHSTLTQQGDALCTVHCDVATHGSLLRLI